MHVSFTRIGDSQHALISVPLHELSTAFTFLCFTHCSFRCADWHVCIITNPNGTTHLSLPKTAQSSIVHILFYHTGNGNDPVLENTFLEHAFFFRLFTHCEERDYI